MLINQEQLKTFILDSGLIAPDDMRKIEKKVSTGEKTLKEVILSEGLLSEDELRRVEAHVLGIPFVNLKNHKIDFELLSLIPEPIARRHNIIAFKKGEGSLEVAMLDTDDLAAIEFTKKKVGLKILPRITDTASIKSALLQYQKNLKAEFGDIIKAEAETLQTVSESKEGELLSEGDLKKLAEDLPVVKIVDSLLKHAIVQNASDIHIEPQEKELLVRYRIDGILHDAMILPKTASPGITARVKVLSSPKLDEKRMPQDGRFKIEQNGEKVSFRVSTIPTAFGEKTVMRLLRERSSDFTLETLGFHGEGEEKVAEATRQKTGMILVTGPTGSGKTTTLYTVLDILNTPEVNISTVEDPIEYQVPRVNQTQVRPDIGFTFSKGLRSLVRQDPDIILVGEIRDTETASLAVNAALTGHLVLSTLHTNSAGGTIPRFLDMGVEPFLLVSTINIIIAQRLVRKLCATKEKYFLTKSEIKHLGERANLDLVMQHLKDEKIVDAKATWEKIPFYKPKKSAQCESGYSGRFGIHEIMYVSPAIRDMVMQGATAQKIEEAARTEGMMTMLEDGIFKAVMGTTSVEEVLRVVSE
jgi:type II secretory ATPase GspE/PulE/Tfp pilus assembly ATPase PilB-like protein